MSDLVLSLFPGLDGFGLGFEQEGYCVVAGPDLKWGRRIQDFHPTPGRFDGVIGGPPCQEFSPLNNLMRHRGQETRHGNQIPEFERCVGEAHPTWFVMENSRFAPLPCVDGYQVWSIVFNNRWLGETQHRQRRISFGTRGGDALVFDVALFESLEWERAVLASESRAGRNPQNHTGIPGPNRLPRRELQRVAELQGFPSWTFDEAPFTVKGAYELIGNAVPVPMARAIASAVKQALSRPERSCPGAETNGPAAVENGGARRGGPGDNKSIPRQS